MKLYKFGERYYDPSTARWTQLDPSDAPLDTHGWNRYIYAGNDPINFIDPSGAGLFHALVNAVASVVYAPYYLIHESRAYLVSPMLLATEVVSLGEDMGLDWIKKRLGYERTICDEGNHQRLSILFSGRHHHLPGCRIVNGHYRLDLP